ncbi:unnamed protein product, partial [Prorocentrum cordatum]
AHATRAPGGLSLPAAPSSGPPQVCVTGTYHTLSQQGKFFFFDPAQWSKMTGAWRSWSGRLFDVRQWRGGANVWNGTVEVWTSSLGAHGNRWRLGNDQWQVGDVVSLAGPRSRAGRHRRVLRDLSG